MTEQKSQRPRSAVKSTDIRPATKKPAKKPATKATAAKPAAKPATKPVIKQNITRVSMRRPVNRTARPVRRPEAISNPAQKTTTKKPVVRPKVLDDVKEEEIDYAKEIAELEEKLEKKQPKKRKNKEPKVRNYPFFNVIRWPLILAQLVTSVLAIIALRRLHLLQGWQFLLVCIVLGFILLINIYILFFNRRAKILSRTIACIGAIVISAFCTIGYIYVQQANDFIHSMAGISQEVQFYETRVLKSSKVTKLEHLAGKKIGFLKSNPNLEETKNGLHDGLNSFSPVEYEEVGSLLAALYDKEIDAAVVNESYLAFLEDAESTFEEDTINIHDIKVKASEKLDLREPVAVTKEPFIIYISGSDSRGAITQTARSDVNIVVIVNPAKGKALTVSIPRDYYVRLHGTTGNLDKLTHAGVYGIEMSKNTIADLLDIKINYTVKVGFQAVERLVNAVDGIDIESDQELHITQEKYGRCDIAKGMNHLNGACALRYARERKSYAAGDRHRGQNQQQVLEAIIKKLSNKHYTARYSKIIDAAKGTFQTSFTDDEIKDFARWQLAELKKWETESIQLDGTGSMQPTYSMGSMKLYVMIPDQSTIEAAKQKIAEYLEK